MWLTMPSCTQCLGYLGSITLFVDGFTPYQCCRARGAETSSATHVIDMMHHAMIRRQQQFCMSPKRALGGSA